MLSEGTPRPDLLPAYLGGTGPEDVRVWMLGGFRVSVGAGRIVGRGEWRLKKAASLVKLLALAEGHRLHREQAMEYLWPEMGAAAASNNLRQALHAARKVLDPDPKVASGYLSSEGETLVLCPGGNLWVDAEAFEAAATAARRSRNPAAYRAATELYAGELLPEDRYEEWAEGRREELRQLYLALLVELAVLHEERGEHERGIGVLRRVLREEPTREEAHASLMRLYALSGRRREAILQYDNLRRALSEGLGAEPSAESRRLYEEVMAGGGGGPPSPSPVEDSEGLADASGRHNLPSALTSFVGRELEVVEAKRLLAMGRLLTLTGAGGSGKTRLALEVARELAVTYPEGAWLVELAPLSEPDLVPQAVAVAVAEATEVGERPGRPLLESLLDALGDKEMLLVLDNCEHLAGAAARTGEALLRSCPRLKVLATSREPLGIMGEVLWQVSPLSLPDATREVPDGGSSVEGLMRYEAVRLFVDRARLKLPDFGLTKENAGAVARVCRKLDGIPLAIELATARIGVLAVEQVAERLEASLDLLKGSSRTAEARQQTLRATLDWGHDLLSGAEQAFFRRLSAFSGGWTLEAAEAVCSDDGIGQAEVLDLLGALVDKSLVGAGARDGGAVRYGMLEPVRQYAREKLEESEQARATRYRHASFFLELAQRADPKLEGPDQPRWLDRLDEEHDNMRAALSWLLQRADGAGMALRMCAALGDYWYLRGHLGEGRRWLEGALATPTPPSAARARALQRVAWLALLQGDVDRSEAASKEGLGMEGAELFRTGGGNAVAAELRGTLGLALSVRGELERATELLEESLALSEGVGSVRGAMVSHFGIGVTWYVRGDIGRALRFLEEAVALSREVGDPSMIASISTHLGYTLLLDGDIDRAQAVSEEAEAMLREQQNRYYIAMALDNLGWAALLRSDPEKAQASFTKSLKLLVEIGAKESIPASLEGLASVAVSQGETRRAARMFGAARRLREAMSVQQEFGEHELEEPYSSAARTRLDEASWDAAFAEGQAMSPEEAVEYALSEEEPSPSARAASPVPSSDELLSSLTRREREVAALAARGLTNRQIATELSISERTAGNHIAKILRKLGLRSRIQIRALAVEDRP